MDQMQSRKLLINVGEYNSLKKKLKGAEKLKVFLEFFETQWEAECYRLKRATFSFGNLRGQTCR